MNALILAALLGAYTATAGNPLAADKAAHLGAGYIAADMCSQFANSEHTLWPILASVAAGAAKETYDANSGGTFDWRDLGCTALGGAMNITVNF